MTASGFAPVQTWALARLLWPRMRDASSGDGYDSLSWAGRSRLDRPTWRPGLGLVQPSPHAPFEGVFDVFVIDNQVKLVRVEIAACPALHITVFGMKSVADDFKELNRSGFAGGSNS